MSLTVTAICGAVALLSLLLILRLKRRRDQHEMEQTALQPRSSVRCRLKPGVLLVDLRQPLDLLAYSEIIPNARRIPPKEVLETPVNDDVFLSGIRDGYVSW